MEKPSSSSHLIPEKISKELRETDEINWSYCKNKGWVDPFSDSIVASIQEIKRLSAQLERQRNASIWTVSGPDNDDIESLILKMKDLNELHRILISLTVASRISFLMSKTRSNENLVKPIELDGIVKRKEEAYGLLCKQLWEIEKDVIRKLMEEESTKIDNTIPSDYPAPTAVVASSSSSSVPKRVEREVEFDMPFFETEPQQEQEQGSCNIM